jgi:hypothetical protein
MKKVRLFLLLLMVALLPLAMQAQQSIPYTYGFENNDLAADGWTKVDCASSTGINSSAKMTGDYGFQFYYNTNPPQYLISPELTGTENGLTVGFYYKNGSSWTETFQVGYSTTDNDVTSFTWDNELTAPSTWEMYENSFPAGTKYVAVKYTANNQFKMYIDDFSFSAPAACPKPTGLAYSNVTTNSATLTWEAGDASAWILEYATSSDFTDATSENVTGTASKAIEGLTAQTHYYVRVKANCGADGESEWCNAIDFTTACAAIVVDADHDFFEGFEGTTFAPDCWDRIAAGSYNWSRYTYTTHQGSGSAYSGYYGDIYLVMPELQIANGTTDVWLKFWSNNSYPSDYDKNSVVLLDGETEIELWSPESVSNSWTEAAINLSEYKGQTIRLAFKYEGSNAHGWYLDDITVAFDPTCMKPSDVALVDGTLTAHSAKISWTDNTENPLGYILLVNDQEVDADENPFTLDLTPETQYTVRVKAVCTTEDTSDLSTDYATFTTPPTCFAPTAVSVPDSTITTTTAIVYWTDNNENDPANGWTILVNDEEVVADVNPFTLPNLTPSTAYTLKVKANCDTDDESAWSAEVHFATLCDAIVVDEEHDFTEGFEGTTFAPLCWNSIPAGTNAWSRTTSSSYVHEGSAAAYSGFYGDIYLVLPDLQIENGSTNVRLTFWSYNRYTSDYDKNSVILLDGETETELWSPETVEQSWEEVSINLSEYMGQTIRLAFKYEGSNAHAWYVDEVKVAFDPACMRPTALTVDTVTANSVTLTWVDNNEERPASWTVSYENNGTAIEAISYDTTITIEELTPETAYTAKVKANCESDWSDAVNFTTLPTCPAPTNLTYSNLTATSVTLDWTVNGEETQWILVLNGQELVVDQKPLTIDTLTEQTPYTAILRAFCAADDTSHNSNTARFVTPCAPQTAEGYTEDFSGYTASDNINASNGVMPDCWNYIGTSGNYRPHVYNGSYAPTDSDNSLVMTAGTSNYGGSPNFAVMPAFDNLSGKMLTFATSMESATAGHLTVGYVTDLTAASYVKLDTIPNNYYSGSDRYVTHEVIVTNVPAGARIAFKWEQATTWYSCAIDDIAIVDMPGCVKPIDVEAVNGTITTTSATIAWTDQNLTAPAYGWTINLNGVDTTVTENPFTFDNLTASTLYTVKVKALCDAEEESDWSSTSTFRTACGDVTIEENNPFVDGFEDYNSSSFPDCWTLDIAYAGYSTYPYVYNSSYSAHNGNNSLYMGFYGATEMNLVSTPTFTNEMNTLQVTFYAKYSSYNTLFVVGVMDGSTFEPVDTIDLTSSYTEHTVSFNNYTGNGSRVAFKASPLGTSTSGYLYLDDVTVELIPSCIRPDGIEVTNITGTTATIDWTDNNETAPQSWTISLNGTDTTVTEHPFTIDNLNASSHYTVKVKANCTDEDESAWSNEESFRTQCEGTIVVTYDNPYEEGFEDNNDFGCWTTEIISGTTDWTHNSTAAVGSNAAYFNYNGGESYLISPVFDLTQASNVQLTFQHRQPQWTGDPESQLYLYYKAAATDEWTLMESYTTFYEEYATETFTLPNPSATYQIAFKGVGNGGYSVYLDDVHIFTEDSTVVTPCATPTNVTYENGVVTWTGDAANYNVHIVAGETTIDTTVSAATYTIEGLNDGDHATVTVQAICDEENLSDWSEAVEFDYIIDGINSYAIQANIYPNPTTGNVTVESNAINADITVFDMFGKLMMTSKVAAERTELNFSSFAPGVYMVRIANSNAITTVKVVKE